MFCPVMPQWGTVRHHHNALPVSSLLPISGSPDHILIWTRSCLVLVLMFTDKTRLLQWLADFVTALTSSSDIWCYDTDMPSQVPRCPRIDVCLKCLISGWRGTTHWHTLTATPRPEIDMIARTGGGSDNYLTSRRQFYGHSALAMCRAKIGECIT